MKGFIQTVEEWDYYGNRPVIWGLDGFTSAYTQGGAAKLRAKVATALRHNTGVSEAALMVAERLEGCEPFKRCNSAACPVCMRARQRWMVREGIALMCRAAHCSVGELADRYQVVHAIAVRTKKSGGKRCLSDMRMARSEVTSALIHCGLEFGIGGLHASLTRMERDRFVSPLRRCIGASLLLRRKHFLSAENQLRQAFAHTDGYEREFVTYPFDGHPRFFEKAIVLLPTLKAFVESSLGNPTKTRFDEVPDVDLARLACHLHLARPESQTFILTESNWSDLGRLYL